LKKSTVKSKKFDFFKNNNAPNAFRRVIS
jgi:hypothetical protein